MQNDKEFKSKIIESGTDFSETEVYGYDEFENWEVYYDLMEKKDYKGLLQYREEGARKFPDDPDTQFKPKRKPQCIGKLHIDFMSDGYLLFTADDLLKAIVEDKRFIVSPENGAFAEVKAARKTANPES